MYKLISSAKDADDLSIAFDRSRDRRKQELTNHKNVIENIILNYAQR